MSLLTCLLGFWIEQKKPNKIFTFGHIRCEILIVFVITIVALLASSLTFKECLVRLSFQPEISTSFMTTGVIFTLISHLVVKVCNDKGKAFAHVFSFSSSNFIQDQMARLSRWWVSWIIDPWLIESTLLTFISYFSQDLSKCPWFEYNPPAKTEPFRDLLEFCSHVDIYRRNIH